MSQPVQTLQNHTKFDPAFHFFLVPLSLVLFIWSLVNIYHYRTSQSMLIAAGFWLFFILVFKTRIYALKVQDRVIRLEERLRLGELCDEAAQKQTLHLTEKQLIALRFASDAEAPALAKKALEENLDPKQIKAAVQKWRADHFRV